jgi:hypothetical protein
MGVKMGGTEFETPEEMRTYMEGIVTKLQEQEPITAKEGLFLLAYLREAGLVEEPN